MNFLLSRYFFIFAPRIPPSAPAPMGIRYAGVNIESLMKVVKQALTMSRMSRMSTAEKIRPVKIPALWKKAPIYRTINRQTRIMAANR